MKKILIVINNMNIGGIQKALLELLKVLASREDLSVSLFCCHHCGELLGQVPQNITILPESKWAKASELTASASKGMGLNFFVFRVIASIWSKVFHRGLPAKMLCKLIGKLGIYDVAVSYSQPLQDKAFCNLTNEIVLNCVRAKRKVTFVHCDFANYGGNTRYNRKLYTKFNAVAAVSDSVGERLCSCIPQIRGKVYTVYNCCDYEKIRLLAAENPVQYPVKTIVTVARLSEEKGLLRCVPVFGRLKADGLQFNWRIVGGGPLENQLKSAICEYGLEKEIIMEGQQVNPYCYLKNAEYLLLPSFHEAAPVVFDEAIALGVPILTTETLSAKELISGRNAGIVCDNNSDAIYSMLHHAISKKRMTIHPEQSRGELCMRQFNAVCDIEE